MLYQLARIAGQGSRAGVIKALGIRFAVREKVNCVEKSF
jgi:hypothetical protein